MQDLYVGPTEIGLISAGFYLPYVLMQIPAGLLLDRFDIRGIWPIAFGLVACGSFLFAMSQNFYVATIARILMGTGAAFAWISVVKIISSYISSRYHSLLIGISMSLGMLGAILGQGPWLAYTESMESWQQPYYLFALIGFILLSLVFFFSRNINITSDNKDKITLLDILKELVPLLKRKNFWILVLFIAVLSSPQTAFTALWGVEFFHQHYQLTRETAASLLSLIWIGGFFGGPILGAIADKLTHKKLVLIFINTATLILFSFIVYHHNLSIITLKILLFFIGMLTNGNVIIFAITSNLTKNISKGLVIGCTNTFNMSGGPIFQLIIGGVLSATISAGNMGNFTIALSAIPIALLLTLIGLLFLNNINNLNSES
jgi:MFS family permease